MLPFFIRATDALLSQVADVSSTHYYYAPDSNWVKRAPPLPAAATTTVTDYRSHTFTFYRLLNPETTDETIAFFEDTIFTAGAAEVARLAQREIESARAQYPLDGALITADHIAARHRIENTLRTKARELGLSLVALGRLVGYLHEHANTAERA